MNTFDKYNANTELKLDNFEKYVRRQALSRFLVRYELFKQVINVKGSIIECGVHRGGGLLAWAKLSAMFEPYALHRKVIGFDTFEGFNAIGHEDQSINKNDALVEGGFSSEKHIVSELKECIADFDNNRYLSQYDKVELVIGDACLQIPEYLNNNKHLIVSLLFLDFDLYEPTKVALECFIDRMPKGSIIAFDEVNNKFWPGETLALLDSLGPIGRYELKKMSFDPNIAYIVL